MENITDFPHSQGQPALVTIVQRFWVATPPPFPLERLSVCSGEEDLALGLSHSRQRWCLRVLLGWCPWVFGGNLCSLFSGQNWAQTLEPVAEYIQFSAWELLLLNLTSNPGPRRTVSCQVKNQPNTALANCSLSFESFHVRHYIWNLK